MRAVNLIPGASATRSASSGAAGTIVYVLLGGLAVMVVLAGLWATASKQISTQQTKLAKVTAEAGAAEARAAAAAPYEAFAAVAQARVSTVKSLSATRFDWAHGLRELSRVLPDDVWLTALDGTSGATGASPTTSASAAPSPTFEITGCTGTQEKVARLLARLRAADGVRGVELKTSEKPDADGDPSCPANSSSDPNFKILVAFKVPGAAKDTVDSTGQVVAQVAPAAAATTTTPAAGTEPAASAPTSTPSTSSETPR